MDFLPALSMLVTACFFGYFGVQAVTQALHRPLMAVTNAISSIIIGDAIRRTRGGPVARARLAA